MNYPKKIVLPCILISALSCAPDHSQKEKPKEEEEEEVRIVSEYSYGESLIMFSGEKVGLISLIYDVPLEKVKSVLSEYLTETSSWNEPEEVLQLIDEVAQRNNLSTKLTAQIVFTFEYEVLTKDEIIEEYVDDSEASDYERSRHEPFD